METLNIYLKQLKNEHSTEANTVELFEKAKNGDDKAREQIIKNHLLLVVKEARKFANRGVPMADLIGEGNCGLIKALDKFDPSKGVFSTHALNWIRASIIRNCMHNNRIVKLPENVSELMRTDRWKGENYGEVSIDMTNDEGDTLADDIPDTTDFDPFVDEESIIKKNKVERLLSFLKSRDADILKDCYGIGLDEELTTEEVAEKYGLTTTRVNQIKAQSSKLIRTTYNELPESNCTEVEIISAKYGANTSFIDVTEKVLDLYLNNENVKCSNRLGGDPIPGVKKQLIVEYIFDGDILKRSFSEGSVVKF
jgi:RNA polymerase sigma factor (sigma-70 family)